MEITINIDEKDKERVMKAINIQTERYGLDGTGTDDKTDEEYLESLFIRFIESKVGDYEYTEKVKKIKKDKEKVKIL